jgi:hypothetical protein
VVILLPTGHRRAVPRTATNLAPSESPPSAQRSLPPVSVRTLLPLATLVHTLRTAQEERSHGPPAGANPPSPSDASRPSAEADAPVTAAADLEPVGANRAAAAGATRGGPDPARLLPTSSHGGAS